MSKDLPPSPGQGDGYAGMGIFTMDVFIAPAVIVDLITGIQLIAEAAASQAHVSPEAILGVSADVVILSLITAANVFYWKS